VFSTGFHWTVYEKIRLMGEIYKDTEFPFVTRVGTVVKMIDHIHAMAGIQLKPDRYSYGLSCSWRCLQISATYRSHFELPHTIYFGCKMSIK